MQRLRQTRIDLFGVRMSQGPIAGLVTRASERFAGLALHVRDAVAQVPVKHRDETGIRVGTSRGDVMRDATGVAVPALCAAHLLRELQDRVDCDDEAGATTRARRLRRAIHAVNLSDGKPLPARLADRIGRRYDSIVAAGLAWHESRPPPPTKGRRGQRKR